MKRTSLLAISAALAAALLPLAAAGQTAPPTRVSAPKYEAFGGLAYTSLNQVNQSRYGLMGFRGAITRDWGKYFGLTGMGDYYKWPAGSGTGINANPGNPSVYSFMVAPGVNLKLADKWSAGVYGELGIEHTGGEQMIPNISFAGGFGAQVTYDLNRRWAIRTMGERVLASFSLRNNSNQLSNSTHMTSNTRGFIGLVYRF